MWSVHFVGPVYFKKRRSGSAGWWPPEHSSSAVTICGSIKNQPATIQQELGYSANLPWR